MTMVSWCTDPVVYLFPMLGIFASQAIIAIQVGYCAVTMLLIGILRVRKLWAMRPQ